MKKIAVIYPYFPHYREGIFREMNNSSSYDFIFIGDKINNSFDIKSFDFPSNFKVFHTVSVRFKKFIFHKNMISHIFFNKYDAYLFHSSPYWITILICVLIVKFRNKPVFNWTHGVIDSNSILKKIIYNIFFRFFDGLFVYGDSEKSTLVSRGFNPSHIHVVYNSLYYDYQVNFRNSLSEMELLKVKNDLFNNNFPVILFIGRLTSQKKLNILVESLAILNDKNFSCNLLLVGEGSDKGNLIKYVERYKLSDFVKFYGSSYSEEENYKLIALSDICVSPGEVGLTAIHSLMYGTPVISHNSFDLQMPEYSSIIKGVNGDFFSFGNSLDLSNKIISWLENNKDRNLVRLNCYSIIDLKFNPSKQFLIFDECFKKYLKT